MHCYDSLVRHEGNLGLFAAAEMSIVSTLAGRPLHVHAEGVRGTGKTTIMRAAASVLPAIERVKGCPHNCRPSTPHCPQHRARQGLCLESEWIPMPFLEISHSAKLGTVVGSIDLARLVSSGSPEAALLPGTIPRANRGILFTDEVNRLADTSPELTDVLLDVMGTKPGRVQIEESGLPVVTLPVECSVWAASNPDEEPGPLEDIRRQLSDRFDLCVEAGRTSDPWLIRRILDTPDFGRLCAGADAAGGASDAVGATARRLASAALLVARVQFPDEILDCMASLYVDFDIESIRAMEAARTAARCRAALAGRTTVTYADLRAVLPMALRHRVDAAQMAGALRALDALAERASEPRHAVGAARASIGGNASPRHGEAEPAAQPSTARPGGGDVQADAGLRAVLKGLLDRVRHDQLSSAQPGGSARPRHDSATEDSTGAQPTDGLRRGSVQTDRPGRPEQRLDQQTPGQAVVCPDNPARPIDQVRPKVVFGEEDLA
ncbi:MAG: magnesium chelatase [Firmicutes bacterium]|nr:magnesium chelatase [Bacillota bacterium]